MGSRFPTQYNSPSLPWGTPPGTIDTEFKVLNTTGSVAAIFSAGSVVVSHTKGAYNTVAVSWPPVASAVSYTVYSGFSLYFANAAAVGTVNAPTVSYTYQYSESLPTDVYPQVWVKANFAAVPSVFVQADPASVDNAIDYSSRANNPLETSYADIIIDNDYMRFTFAEVRRHFITMMQNDGEDFEIYARKWAGPACVCRRRTDMVLGRDLIQGAIVDSEKGIGEEPNIYDDPPNDEISRCSYCFGTGIQGGYFYKYETPLRYSATPVRQIVFGKYALELNQNFNTWGLWIPKVHDKDFVVRVKTGERYEVSGAKIGEIRGIPMHQEMLLSIINPGDIRYTITDAAIAAGEAAT